MRWVYQHIPWIVLVIAFGCLGKVIYNLLSDDEPATRGLENVLLPCVALFLFLTLWVSSKLAKHRLPEPPESKNILDY